MLEAFPDRARIHATDRERQSLAGKRRSVKQVFGTPVTDYLPALGLLIITIGYLATAYTVSRWLTRRCPAVVPMPTHLAAVNIEALACMTQDGITLKGWCIEPAAPRATVALFHGMRNNRSDMLDRIAFLTEAGYRCVAFDHRARGLRAR